MLELKSICNGILNEARLPEFTVELTKGTLWLKTKPCGSLRIPIEHFEALPKRLTKKVRGIILEEYFIPFLNQWEEDLVKIPKLLEKRRGVLEPVEELKKEFEATHPSAEWAGAGPFPYRLKLGDGKTVLVEVELRYNSKEKKNYFVVRGPRGGIHSSYEGLTRAPELAQELEKYAEALKDLHSKAATIEKELKQIMSKMQQSCE